MMKRTMTVTFLAVLAAAIGWSTADAGPALDVLPGNDQNIVNPKSQGVLPVAILGSEDFDVDGVSISALGLKVEGSETESKPKGQVTVTDVNGDDYLDLLIHFPVQETGVKEGDSEICLFGASFTVCDAITTTPKKNPN